MTTLTAIGMMSGTSLDGVDVALIETDGERITHFGPTGYRPYGDAERDLLRQALAAGAALTDRRQRPGILAQAETFVTKVHGDVVEAFLQSNGIKRGGVAVVGFHGQTVIHKAQDGLTVQIGDGAALAARLGIPVAHDFRAADVAAGGQGAPIVPVFHRAIAENLDRSGPLAVLNIGGVANVTYVEKGSDPVACDTGPGNALIDDFMRARTGRPLDRDGDEAAKGRVDEKFLARVCSNTRSLPPVSEVARPQCLRLRSYRAARFFRGRWRRHALGADGGGGGARGAETSQSAALMDRRRRRRA